MDQIYAFLAGLGVAAVAGLLLRSRSLSQQALQHRTELEAARQEGQEAVEAVRAALTQAREAQVRIEGELETARAVAAQAEMAAQQRAQWLELQKKEMEIFDP